MVRAPVISIGFAFGTTLAWADQYSDCSQKVEVDQSIRGCSQIIEKSDREEGGSLGEVYITRGSAYFFEGRGDDFAAWLAENEERLQERLSKWIPEELSLDDCKRAVGQISRRPTAPAWGWRPEARCECHRRIVRSQPERL